MLGNLGAINWTRNGTNFPTAPSRHSATSAFELVLGSREQFYPRKNSIWSECRESNSEGFPTTPQTPSRSIRVYIPIILNLVRVTGLEPAGLSALNGTTLPICPHARELVWPHNPATMRFLVPHVEV